ncbi:2-amino-4-hydroxy-6-hydroxymethyldihydropteridine diphosphokinase [Glaciecola sp.]|jgi:2-amino-4-hydroxy-6-hydroxymethyldihydropteridine diphosphokinase|nr:2-amino-4-hydroxy-6-hydroxymethyldihydropteridine diphosphokinase [Glaciecola sp.]
MATENQPNIGFIGLGANLGDPVANISSALSHIALIPNLELLACSSFYDSVPMGPSEQPNYINAVCKISTSLDGLYLLHQLQSIEQEHGRVRDGEHWGPRMLDLDLLMLGRQTYNNQELTLPHYGMRHREFVLVPLFELQPDLLMPDNHPIAKWVSECDVSQLRRIALN